MQYALNPFQPRQAARAYGQMHCDARVESATPHQLVALLYEGLLSRINIARGALKRGDVPAKGHAIGMAVRIIEEGLRAGLQGESSDVIVRSLSTLYDCLTAQLTQANLHNDDQILERCGRLVEIVREAWASIGAKTGASAGNALS